MSHRGVAARVIPPSRKQTRLSFLPTSTWPSGSQTVVITGHRDRIATRQSWYLSHMANIHKLFAEYSFSDESGWLHSLQSRLWHCPHDSHPLLPVQALQFLRSFSYLTLQTHSNKTNSFPLIYTWLLLFNFLYLRKRFKPKNESLMRLLKRDLFSEV